MLKEDNWCPAPITAYGLDERPERPDMIPGQTMGYFCFEPGKYVGILTAPLKDATYVPDLVLMYPTVNQLRSLLMTIPQEDMGNINKVNPSHSLYRRPIIFSKYPVTRS